MFWVTLERGGAELFKALEKLEIDNVVFVIAGSSKPQGFTAFKYDSYFIPPLKDEISLVLLNNIADVTVVPSLQENLANTILESMSCGVPVVAFDIGGNSDMIDHAVNGYLAKPFSEEDLAKGIEWVLKHSDYGSLSAKARGKVVSQFDSRVVAPKYNELYQTILENN